MTAPWADPRIGAGLDCQLASRAERMAAGERPIGWKVGFGAPASLELMQISAPLVGFLTDGTVLDKGSVVDAADWSRGVVEFEVAVYLGKDLGPGAGEAEVRGAVAAVGPAIELADIDLAPGPDTVGAVVAGNIFHKGVVLGGMNRGRGGLDTEGLRARAVIDGTEFASTTELEALTGSYPDVVATVASTLASCGETLRAGELIITGSVFPPVPVSEGRVFEFALEPFPNISVEVVGE